MKELEFLLPCRGVDESVKVEEDISDLCVVARVVVSSEDESHDSEPLFLCVFDLRDFFSE
jgi:hypothetical protein